MLPPRDTAVAHHEAAHAVIAHLLGAEVREVVLDERNQEQGLSHIEVKGLSEDAIRQILFAGSLAEIKHLAMGQCGRQATFDLKQLDGLEQVAYEKDCLETCNPSVFFWTRSGQGLAITPKHGNVFSDFEDFCVDRRETTSRDDFFRSLRAVMQRMDDSFVWKHVEVVANELLKKGALSSESFLEALGR